MFLKTFRLCWLLTILKDVTVSSALTNQDSESWVPSDGFSNTSSINWFSRRSDENVGKARNFQDEDTDTMDRAFGDYNNFKNEFNERDDFKAIPFQVSEQISTNTGNNPIHLHSTLFPQQSPPNVPKQYYTAAHTSTFPNLGNLIPHSVPFTNAYQHYQVPSQNLENFDTYLPPSSHPVQFIHNVTDAAELNSRHLLYLQPGKCSNSIEIIRIRDLEIKSTVKYGTDNQKAVCILMLYSANENNKLAISMQSVLETSSAELSTENWLQRNLKMYSIQGGTVVRTPIDANFGVNSPALILTRSNIVLLSINADSTLDFQIDISTYQSLTC